jgi:hypothetical protein
MGNPAKFSDLYLVELDLIFVMLSGAEAPLPRAGSCSTGHIRLKDIGKKENQGFDVHPPKRTGCSAGPPRRGVTRIS